MRIKNIFALVFIFLLFQSCAPDKDNAPEERANKLRQQFSWESGSPPMISAHRGGPTAHFPENSLAAFQKSADLGAKIIECDIRTTSDGFLILMHDKNLERTSTGKGKVENHTLTELSGLYLKDFDGRITQHKIPLLGDVLAWAIEQDIYLTLDIKTVEPSHLLTAIKKHKAEGQVIIIVYNFEDMMRYHNMAPHLMLSVSAGSINSLKNLFNYPIPKNRLMVFTGVRTVNSAVYQYLHENKIYCILGTMHNIDNKAKKEGISVYQELYKNGIDIISTDNVKLTAIAIREMKKY
ncbi:MAG: glycerophosphodiester phosphodiesterase family protein [Candidatus Marinimicrobia bacterium]|nr:glycerophosphodiester phosphodiesterase family protein [Candidatus Neomarinimicrobiota bacterium]